MIELVEVVEAPAEQPTATKAPTKGRRRKKRGFGQGSIRKRGLSWSLTWREGSRRRFATAPDEDTAKRMLAKILADKALGTLGLKPDLRTAPTLTEIAEKWHARRMGTHRSAKDDVCRWRCHLGPFFGKCKPAEVDSAMIRRYIEAKLAAGLSSTTVGHTIRLLSTLFTDIVEQGHAAVNPVGALPRSTRRLYKSAQDPRMTPFLERTEDIRRVFLALPEPTATMFAVGALAGLRTSEVLGLSWQDVDLAGRKIHVRQQAHRGKLGPLKDGESRVAPLQNALAPILAAWKLKTGGEGLLFRPTFSTRGGIPGRPPTFVRPNTLSLHLSKALKACGLPALSWYQSTRHSFASHWVMGGESIERLRDILGHSSVVTTERYSHLRPDLFRPSSYDAVKVDLSRPAGDVVSLPASRPTEEQRLTSDETHLDQNLSVSA